MGICAAVLGLSRRGAADDHDDAAPDHAADRHGEAIALRSMAINLSSALMPLAFGLAGATLGATVLFWIMGAAVAGGSLAARHVGAGPNPARSAPRGRGLEPDA